jgi:uncharacterized protein (TIGR02145 family)
MPLIVVVILFLLLSCSGNFEPIPSGSRAGASSVESSSSTDDEYESSSSEEFYSSSTEESSSSSVASSDESSSSITPSSSSNSNCVGFTDNNQTSFPDGKKGKFCDTRDGIIYSYVFYSQINQTWMAENLNYKTDDSMCYDDIDTNCNTYGRLYNSTAENEVCPEGWHLPKHNEWGALARLVNNNCKSDNINEEHKGCSDVSNVLMSEPFLAKLGGYCNIENSKKKFMDINLTSNWLTGDSNANSVIVWTMDLNTIIWLYKDKNSYYSVRCVKDN